MHKKKNGNRHGTAGAPEPTREHCASIEFHWSEPESGLPQRRGFHTSQLIEYTLEANPDAGGDNVALIAQRFGMRLSVWTVGPLLARLGFTAQKPARVAFEQDSKAVTSWLKGRYRAIHVLAHREKAVIFWADEMGLRGDHAAGRSFSPKGRTPVILGTGQRFRCNLISALTNRGYLQFMGFKNRFTVAVLLKSLRRPLRQNRGRKLFLILDNHPVHVAKAPVRWFKARRAALRVYFLPGYNPELNPDEYLNQDVKTNAVGRTRPLNRTEMIGNIRAYLRSTQAHRPRVKRYFHAEHVRYASL